MEQLKQKRKIIVVSLILAVLLFAFNIFKGNFVKNRDRALLDYYTSGQVKDKLNIDNFIEYQESNYSRFLPEGNPLDCKYILTYIDKSALDFQEEIKNKVVTEINNPTEQLKENQFTFENKLIDIYGIESVFSIELSSKNYNNLMLSGKLITLKETEISKSLRSSSDIDLLDLTSDFNINSFCIKTDTNLSELLNGENVVIEILENKEVLTQQLNLGLDPYSDEFDELFFKSEKIISEDQHSITVVRYHYNSENKVLSVWQEYFNLEKEKFLTFDKWKVIKFGSYYNYYFIESGEKQDIMHIIAGYLND